MFATLAISLALLAGCGSGTPVSHPAPTTTSPYTRPQVLGWVTPTLENGASLLKDQSDPDQFLIAARAFATACGVSQRELGQVSWTGASHGHEVTLYKTLTRIQNAVSETPGEGLSAELSGLIEKADNSLAQLNREYRK